MTEQDLLELIRAGKNDKALAQLYRHLPPIRRMIRHYGGSREQAEDIFQEALIILCRKARSDAQFQLPSGSYPYLYSVCRFLWKDELKRQQRDHTLAADEALEDLEDALAAELAEEAQYRLAERIVSELGERCKELLLLYYTQRLRLRDIASRMGYSSEQTAKNQKYKCLETARDRYRKEHATLSSL